MDILNSLVSELATHINSGKAILFTGAGFSSTSINIQNDDLPRATELARKICELGKFEIDDDLRYASEYYLDKDLGKEALIDLLKTTFTCRETTPAQQAIAAANWRRIYTTNYDNTLEQAALANSKLLETVDISRSPKEFTKNAKTCIHLNGAITKLTPSTLENQFKLSTSSYVSPDSFLSSPWHFQFKRDLDTCSALVFIGYSLYDIEIQKILYENRHLVEKTYFITQKNPSSKSTFTLKKYGQILAIGVEEFGNLLAPLLCSEERSTTENLSAIRAYEPTESDTPIRDRDVESLILYGDTTQAAVDRYILRDPDVPFLVNRKELEIVERFTQAKRHTVLIGTFGNGKSLLLQQIAPYLFTKGYDVYFLSDPDGDFSQDIEIIRGGKKSVVLIDDYPHHIDLIKTIGHLHPENVHIITTARIYAHEYLRNKLKDYSFSYQELSIDQLSEQETTELIEIIDNLGAWGDKAYYSQQQKFSFLANDNDSQISLTLLSLFNSDQIKKRVAALLNFFGDGQTPQEQLYKDTAFAIALIEIIGLQTSNSLISEIALNDEIYSDALRQNESFQQLFRLSDSGVRSKSSLFSMALIRNHFLPSYTVPQLLRIAKKYGAMDNKNQFENEAFRSVVKFSFIERLLPDANKKSNIRDYYERLKNNVDWLKSDPHFWLQYAMAQIPFKEYAKAQQYIDQSYALAKKKINYHTNHHDTQQGRLYLLIALEPKTDAPHEYFSKAHKLFCKIDNDIYKFRQVIRYTDYYETCYTKIAKRYQTEFEHACKRMVNDIDQLIKDRSDSSFNAPVLIRTREQLSKVLDAILAKR
ncbi:SIR2 family protein [Pseudomonas sp. BW16M2]|uniref:P-loop NTPase n=1 Tax=Pseudomonas sp. BW16M2 TaxID=2745489 RepID=UPI001644A165|nr:SIR2 family protein [Pseudomonas sp. BW16M2]MBC3436044.1 SIR2 family protein [Pseudomonas sp. BW16M2]